MSEASQFRQSVNVRSWGCCTHSKPSTANFKTGLMRSRPCFGILIILVVLVLGG